VAASLGESNKLGPANRSLRVLLVHDSLADNGGIRVSIDLAECFAHAGAAPTLYAVQPVRDGRSASVDGRVPLIRGVPEDGRLRSHGPGAIARLLKACRRADVVVSGSELGLGLIFGYWCARLARRPFAVIAHAPLPEALERWVRQSQQPATRFVHRHADAAICVSRPVLESIVANGLEPRRVHLVRNGVDVARVRGLAAADPIERTAPTVVAVGRLSLEKGFDLLIRAHADVRHGGVLHELEIVGEGPEREALARLAEELNVADSVALVGFQENPYRRLAGAAAFVLPSRLEGFSLSLLEALALGVPVIAARTAHAASDLLGADVGQLVEGNSVPALASALRDHLESPARLRHRARPGLAVAEAHDFSRVAEDYLHILAGLAQRPPDLATRRRRLSSE
jgi:glycosyltransferase involved in cell wall biosynthesis